MYEMWQSVVHCSIAVYVYWRLGGGSVCVLEAGGQCVCTGGRGAVCVYWRLGGSVCVLEAGG